MQGDRLLQCLIPWGWAWPGSRGSVLGLRKSYLDAEEREEQVQAEHSAHVNAPEKNTGRTSAARVRQG